MKNSKLRRALLLLACAVMLVSLSVGATLAYLSSTDSVKNTFTVGQVNIWLDEGTVYPVGTIIDGEYVAGTHNDGGATRTEENAYKVYPGMTYDKDPVVHIQGDSEDCYVGVTIKLDEDRFATLAEVIGNPDVGEAAQFLGISEIVLGGIFDKEFAYDGNTTWTSTDGELKLIQTPKTGEFYVIFLNKQLPAWADADNDGIWDAGEGQINLDLFKQISIPADWDNTELAAMQGLEMTITAYAVQAEGFANADAALLGAFPDAFAVLK